MKNKSIELLNCEDGLCETDQVKGAQSETPTNAKTGDKLLYFGDAMCSWCWGITNHLDRIKEEFADKLDFEIVLGGLRPGGGDEWTPEFRAMLQSHWGHVHEASGQPFDYQFFERDEFNYDTEPPARAVRVVRDIDPNKEWLFYKSLQRLFYAENTDISDLRVLENLCHDLEIDFTSFEPLFLSEGYKKLVYQDFMRAQQLGVRGFPSVVVQKGDEYFAVSMGYSSYEKMKEAVLKIQATQT